MNIYKISLIGFVFTSLSITLPAQNSLVVDAIFYQRDSNYVKAKESIDKAVVNEKTLNSPKAWFTKGQIYEGIALSNKPEVKQIDTNAAIVSYDAYSKAISFDKPNGSFAKDSKERLQNVWVILINSGIKSYQTRNFDKALQFYKAAQEIKPTDTTAFVYASFVTEAKQDITASNTIYEQLAKLNYNSISMHFGLIQYAKEIEKNYDKALTLISKARALYPNENVFLTEEFNIYLTQGKSDLAKQKLEEAIQKTPNNSLLYFNLGVLSEQIGPKEKAPEYYQKAIELKPDNTDALFNLGAYYYHQAAANYKLTSNMSVKTYNEKGKQLEADANELFKKALPNFEKVYSIQPDKQTKKILIDIYMRLKMNDKADALFESK